MLGQCPNCNGKFEVQPEWIGQKSECPYCHQTIVIQSTENPFQTGEAGNSGNNNYQNSIQNANGQDNIAVISPFGCYMKVIKNYAGFSGRASRKEFWYFVLFNFLIACGVGFISGMIGAGETLGNIYSLVVLLPSIAVAVRRLHDINKSGWWLLIVFIPIVGAILLIFDYAREGNHGANKYGNDPYDANGI